VSVDVAATALVLGVALAAVLILVAAALAFGRRDR
jgi:hypothetical protein